MAMVSVRWFTTHPAPHGCALALFCALCMHCLCQMADHKSGYPYMFCGTTTGDILGINMKSYQMQFLVPVKDKFSLGVSALSIINFRDDCTYDFLVGTGDGLVGRYEMKVHMDKHHHMNATWKHHCDVK